MKNLNHISLNYFDGRGLIECIKNKDDLQVDGGHSYEFSRLHCWVILKYSVFLNQICKFPINLNKETF